MILILAFLLNHNLRDSLKRGTGVDGELLGQDGRLRLCSGHQGGRIWVNVVLDVGLG